MTTYFTPLQPASIEKYLQEVDGLTTDDDSDDDDDAEEEEEEEEDDDDDEGGDYDDDDDDSLSSVSESSAGLCHHGEDDSATFGISFGALLEVKDRPGSGGAPGDGNRSMPNMQIDFDMSGVEMSEIDNRSLANFMVRMNSSSNVIYFQDASNDEKPQVPTDVNIAGGKKKPRLSATQDDLALTATDRAPNPHNLFLELIEGVTGIDLPDSYWETYFEGITEERVQAYTVETVKAVRSQDLKTLRAHLDQQGRTPLEACNKQGESIIHLACRRRNEALVRFMVEDAKVSVKVRDDWGKTPLHELCWNSRPRARSQFDSFRLLLKEAPELLFAKDKRGYTPLQYVPKDSWKDWQRFLNRYKKMIRCKVQLIGFVQSREKLRETMERANSTMTLLSNKSSFTKLSGK
jgi:Ankyrin repeats (3 copies)